MQDTRVFVLLAAMAGICAAVMLGYQIGRVSPPRDEARHKRVFFQGMMISQAAIICQFMDRLEQKRANPAAEVEKWPELTGTRMDAIFAARDQFSHAPDCAAIRQILAQEPNP